MLAVTYTIELLEPLLATSLDGDPNTKRSLSYIPGSMIRGALIGLYCAERKMALLDNANEDGRRLFLTPQTRYLNAYPQITVSGKQYRTLPASLSWRKVKGEELKNDSTIYDFAIDTPAEDCERTGKEFSLQLGNELLLCSVSRDIRIHTARARKPGRAVPGDGAVFQYDALKAGQRFEGLILTDNLDDAKLLCGLLTLGQLWVGGSREAGYGRIKVWADINEAWQGERIAAPIEPAEFDEYDSDDPDTEYADTGYAEIEDEGDQSIEVANAETQLQDLGAQDSPTEKPCTLYLSCLSACQFIDAEGQPVAQPNLSELADRLGIAPEAIQLDNRLSQRDIRLMGGFNRAMGLPIPQKYCVEAGSLFVYQLRVTPSDEGLRKVEENGIGEQRLDGFGRVSCAIPQPSYIYRELKPELPLVQPPPVVTDSQHLLQQMGERILRARLDISLAGNVRRLHFSGSKVSNSLLSRLRTAIRTALVNLQQASAEQKEISDLAQLQILTTQPLRKFLDELKASASDQLRRARVGREVPRLLAWLQITSESVTPIQETVQLGALKISAPPAWQIEYNLRLMDEVLYQAQKDNKQSSRKPHRKEAA